MYRLPVHTQMNVTAKLRNIIFSDNNIPAQISALYFSLASQRQCYSKIIDGSWNRPLGAHVAEVNNECVPYAWSALVPN